MESSVFILLFFSAFSSGSANFVYDLNAQNFDQMIREKDIMLVDFYAPWRPVLAAKELSPSLQGEVHKCILAGKGLFQFAKVDCTDPRSKVLCDNFKIEGYPSVKLFKFGKYAGDYIGQRTDAALVNYMESVTSTASQQAPFTSEPMNNAAQLMQPQTQPFAPQQAPQPMPFALQPQAFNSAPIMQGFFNSPQAQLQVSQPQASAYASGPAAVTGPKVSASPDPVASHFGGNMLALEILRAKLKMIAAYKNWQKRLKEYKEKMAEAATGSRFGVTKAAIAKKPFKAGARSKLAHYKPAPTHFLQKFPRILNAAQKHAKEVAQYKLRKAAYQKALAARRQQIAQRRKKEQMKKYNILYGRSNIPMYQYPQYLQSSPYYKQYYQQQQARAMIPHLKVPQAQPQASLAQYQPQSLPQEAVDVVQPEADETTEDKTPEDESNAESNDKSSAKSDDSPSINDLRADIESAIKDALKTGDKKSAPKQTAEASDTPQLTANKPQSHATEGSGEVVVTSSPTQVSAQPVVASGSGSKAGSGSGSGDAGALLAKIRRMVGEE
ncbi:predicted protein [Nematostella vectensis]|uniref:protein disulfide-isomerase n=1 Tax=Nematostella vectensis TaxID=45351 RepID=A7SXD4_NEMVE|nr:predicted protein [Nematostella vectensis]|eukprot:XP_001623731.1 predicted protein [Nematostella vectensis]